MATAESVKAKINNLVAKANTKTNKSDKDLTSAVNSLIAGYGQGGGSGGGSCSGNHIIEVDTLPTENIDENAIYKCNDTYYQAVKRFNDLLLAFGDSPISCVQVAQSQGKVAELYYTENYKSIANAEISPYDANTSTGGFYYDASRNDVFVYTSDDNAWHSYSFSGFTNGGAITNETEATTEYYYYALIGTSFCECVPVEGGITITENGSYNVKNTASVVVDVPNEAVIGVWKFNDTINITDYSLFSQNVNFSLDGNSSNFISMRIQMNIQGTTTWYELQCMRSETDGIKLYHSNNGWITHPTASDFGTEIQKVTSGFKEWLVANATPIYAITITRTE